MVNRKFWKKWDWIVYVNGDLVRHEQCDDQGINEIFEQPSEQESDSTHFEKPINQGHDILLTVNMFCVFKICSVQGFVPYNAQNLAGT